MRTIFQVLFIELLCSVIWTEAMGEGMCKGSIGDVPSTFNKASRSAHGFSGVYLNLDNSSTCTGTVVAWEYCYYFNDMHGEPSEVMIKAGVWRPNNTEYQLVDDSLMRLPIPTSDRGLQFACWKWILNSSEAFQVQKGDIVGIHVNDSSDMSVVHILGITEENATIELVMAENVTDEMSSITEDQLTNASYVLYLMAVIDEPDPEVTTEYSTGSPVPSTTQEGTTTYRESSSSEQTTVQMLTTTSERTTTSVNNPVPTTSEQTTITTQSTGRPTSTTEQLTSSSTSGVSTTSEQQNRSISIPNPSTTGSVVTTSGQSSPPTSALAATTATTSSRDGGSTETDPASTTSTSSGETTPTEPTNNSTAMSVPHDKKGNHEYKWYIATAILCGLILALLVTITILICKPRVARRRNKTSGPVLMTYRTGTLSRIIRAFRDSVRQDMTENDEHRENAQLEANISPQMPAPGLNSVPLSSPRSSRCETVSPVIKLKSPSQSAPIATLSTEQQVDEYDRVTMEPRLRWPPPGTEGRKRRTRPSRTRLYNMRKSQSAFDVSHSSLIRVPSDADSAQFTFSSDYPYVLHTHEVMGKQSTPVESLPPAIDHYTPLPTKTRAEKSHKGNLPSENLHEKRQAKKDYMTTGSMLGSPDEFEPSYGYTDKKTVVLLGNYGTPASQNDQTDDQDDDESASEGFYFEGKPAMAMVKHRAKSTCHGAVVHPLSTKHTSQSLYMKPPTLPHASWIPVNEDISTHSNDSYVRNRYMKLLKTNEGDLKYESFLKVSDPRELSDLTMSERDSELEHPKEWCRDTKT